jgi:2-keto-4-pentenoate hydratase/2-oxohepta-3-ene-1,7-dioic acid hydratase in catechol pathway
VPNLLDGTSLQASRIQMMPPLRIANIVHAGAEVLAVEHNGMLFSVPEIERCFDLGTSPAQFTDAVSFRRRILALGLAGLSDVTDVLSEGPPPPEALLQHPECMFLPPTTAEPAIIELAGVTAGGAPVLRRGFGRCLLGHDAPLAIPADEPAAEMSAQIAAVLGEDVRDATTEQAQRAILGYSILSLWTMPSRERCSPGWGQYRLGQLGPCLVVPEPPFDPSDCSLDISVNAQIVASAPPTRWPISFAELIAFASDGVELRAGDVIASGPLAHLSRAGASGPREHDRVCVDVATLGSLSGVVVAGKPSSLLQRWARRS